MIINIRGSFGSGKSTLIHQLLATHPSVAGQLVVGTKYHALPALSTAVLGSYRTQCGGCDAVKTQDLICDGVRELAFTYQHVLFEGALVSGIAGRYIALAQEFLTRPFVFLFLSTSLVECIASVNARRAIAGKGPLADPKNIIKLHNRLPAISARMREAGCRVEWMSREEAAAFLRAEVTV